MRSDFSRALARRHWIAAVALVATPSAAFAQAVVVDPNAQVAEVASDTGRMRPAHRDFSRYVDAAMCVDAVMNVQHRDPRLLWDEKTDTIAYAEVMAGDTLSTNAVEAARACAPRVDFNNVSPNEIPSHSMMLALQLGDDVRAKQVLDRQLAAAHTLYAQSQVLKGAIQVYTEAHPARFSAAKETLRRLDALGAEARVAQIEGTFDLGHALALHRDAAGADSMYDQAIAKMRQLTVAQLEPGARQSHTVFDPFFDKIIVGMHLDPQKTQAVINQFVAMASTGRYAPYVTAEAFAGFTRGKTDEIASYLAAYGKPMPRPTGAYEYSAGGIDRWKRPGALSMIVQMPEWRVGSQATFYSAIRQLHRRFGEKVGIILVAPIAGYVRGSLPLTPDAEADSMRRYFLEYQKLPVTLVVDAPSPVREAYPFIGSVMIIGADGTLRHIIETPWLDEEWTRMVLDRALKEAGIDTP